MASRHYHEFDTDAEATAFANGVTKYTGSETGLAERVFVGANGKFIVKVFLRDNSPICGAKLRPDDPDKEDEATEDEEEEEGEEEEGELISESERIHLANFKRNYPKLFEHYMQLPLYQEGQQIKCPTKNTDGTDITADDICGCGSTNISWDGDVYDCCDCGIFFSDYAADPPHRRIHGRDEDA